MVEEFMGVSETQTVVKSLSAGLVIPLMLLKVIAVRRDCKFRQ